MKQKRIAVFLILLLSAASLLVWFRVGTISGVGSSSAKKLVIEQENVIIYEALLTEGEPQETKRLYFTGLAGEYVVETEGGKVRMLSAQCPDKLCVHQGWSSHRYNPIICLPQKVIISIEDVADDEAVDVLVR
ncbi:MAG: NusG domain II-containing protein [Syntrophomonadaceae bacterium]|nr:NusG domain II-containing protein [Syntrophomonadaceae bacterium]